MSFRATVVQPAYEIGRQGAEMLIRHIESGEPQQPVEIRLMPELHIRESTRPRGAVTSWPAYARSAD